MRSKLLTCVEKQFLYPYLQEHGPLKGRTPQKSPLTLTIITCNNSGRLEQLTMNSQVKVAAVKFVLGWNLTSVCSCKVWLGCDDVHLKCVHLKPRLVWLHTTEITFYFCIYLKVSQWTKEHCYHCSWAAPPPHRAGVMPKIDWRTLTVSVLQNIPKNDYLFARDCSRGVSPFTFSLINAL